MMKKRMAAFALSLALLAGSISTSPVAFAESESLSAELSSTAELMPLSADLFDFTIPTDHEYKYTVSSGSSTAVEQERITVSVKEGVTGVGSVSSVRYTPKNSEGGWDESSTTYTPPKYAGTYKVSINVGEGTAYEGGTVVLSESYTVNKKTLTKNDFNVMSFYTGYDGEDKSYSIQISVHQNGCTLVCDFRIGSLMFKKYNETSETWETVQEVCDLGKYQLYAASVAPGSDGELVNIQQIPEDAPIFLEEFEITKGTVYNTDYTVKIPHNAPAEETTLTLSEIFGTEYEDVPADAKIESGTITGTIFGLDTETELSVNAEKNAIKYTPVSEITSVMTGKAVFSLSSYGYDEAQITVNFEVNPKLTRENVQYDITVASTNTDTEEKSVSLSDLLGGENVPAENVTVTPQSENGDIADIVSAISFAEGALKYTPKEKPADGKAGNLVFTVSSDDYEDFAITVNLEAKDIRETIEDISFEELEVDPDEHEGVYTGYPLSTVAQAAFDNPSELLEGFEYHGISFSENAEKVLKEAETYYTDNWGGFFIFTFEEPLERGNAAWVRYEVSSDKYKPFGLVLYFNVPKLERENPEYSVSLDAYGVDKSEKSVTLSELLGNTDVPDGGLKVSEDYRSDNFSDVISSIKFEDNTLKYTPNDVLAAGTKAELVLKISSNDYEDFLVTVFFNVLDMREVHNDISHTVSISHQNADTTGKTLTIAELFGGEENIPAGLLFDLSAKTVSENISSVLLSYEVSESGITYSVMESPKSSAYSEISIPVSADGYKDFKITVGFKVSSSSKGPSAFVVHFDTDGGSKIENKIVSRGKRLEEPTEPTKDGYSFDGWYTGEELTKEYDFTRSVGRNFTLYAKWIPDEGAGKADGKDETENGGNAQATVYRIIFTIDKKEANVFGDEVTYDVAPIIVDSRTMLSARYVAENLGADVEWDASVGKGKVTITKGQTEIILYIGEKYAHVNGERVDLDVVPFIENSRTYYPARFIAERLGATVEWDETNRTVTISTTEKPVWNEKFM